MPRWRACYTTVFSAAHEVRGHPMGGLHGHDFRVTVCVCREGLGADGFVVDYYVLRGRVEEVTSRLDHRLLNEVLGVERASLEALASHLLAELSKRVEGVCTVRVCGPEWFCVEVSP